MESYLGLHINHTKQGEFTISQPFLVDRIIDAIPGMKNARISSIPASTDIALTKNLDGGRRNGD